MGFEAGITAVSGRDLFPLEDKLLPLQYGVWKSGPELLRKMGQFNCTEVVIGISIPLKKSCPLCSEHRGISTLTFCCFFCC